MLGEIAYSRYADAVIQAGPIVLVFGRENMLQANRIIEQIRGDLHPVNEQLLRHPYLQSLEDGLIQREKLRLFAGEQYATISSDLRSVAHLVSRCDSLPSRDFFLGVLQGEKAAWDALLVFARALGLDEAELGAYEPLPGAHAYTCFMAWLACYGSDAEIAAAYLVNFPAWGQNCGRLSRILKERYGLGEPEVAFFDLFATLPPTFETDSLIVIQHGLDHGGDPRRVSRAARLLQAYERLYWDALYTASVGP